MKKITHLLLLETNRESIQTIPVFDMTDDQARFYVNDNWTLDGKLSLNFKKAQLFKVDLINEWT